ncbi:hypothetical protein ACF1BS_04260 [Streptomyces sp. NPDC014748]|uniref:hypothetical protein n=1 Tax=Streptomyces sp. NPDC014748 TaxID=3364905 RepID=UPI0036F4D1C2
MSTPPARRPARRPATGRKTAPGADAGSSAVPSPVEVRLIGDDAAVRTLVAALRDAAACGPASYRKSRDGDATRAYLSVVVPADGQDPAADGGRR